MRKIAHSQSSKLHALCAMRGRAQFSSLFDSHEEQD